MTNFWQQMVYLVQAHWWAVSIVSIIVITILASLVEKFIYVRLYSRLRKTKKLWDDALFYALHRPLQTLIWLTGLFFTARVILGSFFPELQLVEKLSLTNQVILVLAFTWFVARYIAEIEYRYMARRWTHKKLDKSTVHAVAQLSRFVLYIIAALIGLQIFGVPLAGLLAFGGVGGIAVGFAAKDTLANFFGGFMVLFDRPFTVGDWILSPDRDIEGTVEYIGWRLTCIRRFDKRPLYLPNSVFSMIGVINASRMTNRRINADIGIRYDDAKKLPVILNDIREMLKNHPEIDQNQTTLINFIKFGEFSLDFMIYTFTKTVDWATFQNVQEDVFLKIIEIVEKHGARCAFPTTTLEVPKGLAIQSQE